MLILSEVFFLTLIMDYESCDGSAIFGEGRLRVVECVMDWVVSFGSSQYVRVLSRLSILLFRVHE